MLFPPIPWRLGGWFLVIEPPRRQDRQGRLYGVESSVWLQSVKLRVLGVQGAGGRGQVFNHEIHEKVRNFFCRAVALTDGLASGIAVWFVAFSDCLAFLASLRS